MTIRNPIFVYICYSFMYFLCSISLSPFNYIVFSLLKLKGEYKIEIL